MRYIDTDPPGAVALSISSSRLASGDTLVLTFDVDEPLAAAPVVRAGADET